MLIVEGAKGTGKTSFINYYQQKSNRKLNIVHATGETPNTFNWHESLIFGDKQIDVCDRFALGEMIYPDLYHRTPRMNQKQFDKLMTDIENFFDGTLVILYSSIPMMLVDRVESRDGVKLSRTGRLILKRSNDRFYHLGKKLIKNHREFLKQNKETNFKICLIDTSKYNTDQTYRLYQKLQRSI